MAARVRARTWIAAGLGAGSFTRTSSAMSERTTRTGTCARRTAWRSMGAGGANPTGWAMPPRYLTAADVASQLQVSLAHAYRLLALALAPFAAGLLLKAFDR